MSPQNVCGDTYTFRMYEDGDIILSAASSVSVSAKPAHFTSTVQPNVSSILPHWIPVIVS